MADEPVHVHIEDGQAVPPLTVAVMKAAQAIWPLLPAEWPDGRDLARTLADAAVTAAAGAIRAEEREDCARLAEQESDYCGVPIAELIRARGKS